MTGYCFDPHFPSAFLLPLFFFPISRSFFSKQRRASERHGGSNAHTIKQMVIHGHLEMQ